MRNDTRILLNAYVSQVALLNGVPDATVTFSVAPAVEQKLEEKIQASSAFLEQVSFVTVAQQEGDKVGIGITRPLASRTNTAAGNRRTPSDPTDSFDNGRYRCEKTDFDHAIRYAKLDAWRHKPEFQTLVRDVILKQQGRDRIMIGFHGTHVAVQTDRVAYPMLQDVNIGWLHKLRTFAPARVLSDGALTAGAAKAIYVAEGTPGVDVDYVNLDALATDAIELLDEHHRDDTEIVVICGRDLVQDKYFPIINAAANTATEIEARDRILASAKKIGGKAAISVPFFPANAMMVTSLNNLAIYNQEGTRRRQLRDEPALDQIENYESVNEAYVIEDYGRAALVENIVLRKKPA